MPHWSDLLAAIILALPAFLAWLTGRANKKTITVILQKSDDLYDQNKEIKGLVNGKLGEAKAEILELKALVKHLELRLAQQ